MSTEMDALSSLDRVRLLVVGDLMLDQYTWADVDRISPEAPVMVLQAQQEEVRLGGAASVASLLAGLQVRSAAAGVIGEDPAGRVVERLLAERHGAAATSDDRRDLVLIDPDRPTTVKERLLGRAANRSPHQILRLDRECRRPLDRDLELRLIQSICDELPRCQAALISDYAKGVCTPAVTAAVIRRSRELDIPVLVDPARGADFNNYRGATLIKANRHEAQSALGASIQCQHDAFAAARELCRKWEFDAAVITLDRDGVVLATADGARRHFDAQVHEVCDVTGAGDTVLAVLGACLGAGVELAEAVRRANVAALLQVQRVGVGQITREELRQALGERRRQTPPERAAQCSKARPSASFQSEHRKRAPDKVISIEALLLLAEQARKHRMRIVLANGCFDLLHVGHVTCLEQAAEFGDMLVVAVNSDRSVRRLKGDDRPVIEQAQRVRMVAALEAVDRVVILDDDDPCELLRRLQPDVLVKGGGYRPDQVVGREIVEAYGGRVRLADHVQDVSTSQILHSLPPR